MTPRRRRFVEEYCKAFDAAHAAVRAGFARSSGAAYGHYLLRQPEIVAALEARMESHARECRLTADRVVAELARIAFSDMRDYADWGGRRVAVKRQSEIAPERAAAIAAVAPGGKGTGTRIRLQRKKQALRALARHVGLFERRAFVDPKLLLAEAARIRTMLLAAAGLSHLDPEAAPEGEGT